MATSSLSRMSVTKLLALRNNVDKVLLSRRDELKAQLSEIGGGGDKMPRSGDGLKGGRGKVAPKYRHPKTGETWPGRGATVGWLAAEIRAGKKKEEFLIGQVGARTAKKKK